MSRLTTTPVAEATGQAAQLFTAIRGAIGMVPNAYAAIGSNSPSALAAMLAFDGAAGKASLSGQEVEAVKLAVSEVSGCDYCLAAHSMMAKKKGVSKEAVLALRHGQQSGDAKLDALATFARTLVSTRGTASDATVAAVRAAGYSDQQIVDTLLVMASITFTNLVNRVNDTVLDFPAAD